MSSTDDPASIAAQWLSSFASALSSHKAEVVAATFLPTGWLRDILTFTWDSRSLEGTEKIANYLSHTLPNVEISNLKLSDDPHFLPATFAAGPAQGVEFGYTFETTIAWGRGFARLLPDESSQWKALTASTIMEDLKGHEEAPGRRNFEELTGNLSWSDYEAKRKSELEANPHVIISKSSTRRSTLF